MDYLEKELSDEYVFLMRTHQYTNNLIGVTFNDFCRDYCSYPSINDLLIVSDIMISDYSTCIRDYSILERPIICFAYDYEDYVSTRGIYIDFQTELPSGVVRTQQDVVKYIKNMNYTKECEKTHDMIKAKFEQYGGSATEMCVNKLKKNNLCNMVPNATILAAGKSTCFAPFAYERPKGLFRVKGEILIERQITQFIEAES